MEYQLNKPELLHTSPLGATIHSYDLTGGKTTFNRFLGCYLGSCSFYDTIEEAKKSLNESNTFDVGN